MATDDLLNRLMALLPAELEVVIWRLEIPSEYLSGQAAPQSIRAIEIIKYLKANNRIPDLIAALGAPGTRDRDLAASPVASPSPSPKRSPVRCFFSFHRKDEPHFASLSSQLRMLQRAGKIDIWAPTLITPGAVWADEIERRFADTDLFVPLISSDFLAADDTYQLAERAVARGARDARFTIVPVIVRPCSWQMSPFAKLAVLPEDGKALSTKGDIESAIVEIVESLTRIVERARGTTAQLTT